MTFAHRLYLLLLIAIAGLGGLAIFANNEIEQVYSSADLINVNTVQSMKIIDELRGNFLNSRIKVRSFIMSTDPAKAQQVLEWLNTYRLGVAQAIALYLAPDGCMGTACVYDSRDEANLKEVKTLWEQYDKKLDEELRTAADGEAGKARAVAMISENLPLAEQLNRAIDNSFNYNLTLTKNLSTEALRIKNRAINLSLLIAALSIAIVTGIGLFIIRYVLRSLGGEPARAAEIANRMALGDLSSDISIAANDKTSMMAAIKTLMSALNRVSSQADAISAGNLSEEVAILSEHDKLGKAINHMVVSLRTAKIIDERRIWLNEGHNQLAHALTGDFNQQRIAETAIEVLGHYLNAGRGVIYILRVDEPVLELVGSYMYSDGAKSFRLGEGAIGQVAREKKPIILNKSGIDTAPIVTGTGSALPEFTYTYPLLQEDSLIGVIELSSFAPFSEMKLDMLLRACEIIASFLYISEQREKINQLLAVSEQAELATRTQNARLQDINSQMEEQQQQLQQQSEELQQSNAQMESQQQLLQQQSEELRMANAQMNEQQKLLEQNNRELLQSQTRIDEKAQQLEQSNNYKSEFLANMSHELRTPLNAIILLSKMMADNRDGKLPEAEVKKAAVINRSGKDLLHLINDVLDLSKVDAGRMDLNFESIASSALIANLHDLFASIAQERGVAFLIEDRLQGTLISDPDKLNQILRNLLSNAFKFTKSGAVTLSVARDLAQTLPIRITVKDTGIGIAANKLGTIFEAFRQVDGSISREYGGTGLGLTISLSLARLLGGTIEISSESGQGSEFSVCLPLNAPLSNGVAGALPVEVANQQALLPVPAQFAPVIDDRSAIKPGDRVILLIDDDVEFCRAVVEINHKLHYKTLVAHSAAESLILARRHRPEGILLDLGLPDRDGADLLQEMKSSQDLASIPVYVISARDHDQMTQTHSIVGYIQKPVSQEQIAEAEALLLAAIDDEEQAGILIVSTRAELNTDLLALISSKFSGEKRTLRQTVFGADLLPVLQEQAWGAVIINMTESSVIDALHAAQLVRSDQANTSLLFYGADHLNDGEELQLRAFTDSIINKAATAQQRLLDNTERFLRKFHQTEQVQTSLEHIGSPDKRLAGKIVLVVDDDIRNLFVLTAALEQEGARVFNASNGKRAMELLEFERVDIIITDIMMPEMDGYQTIAAIRANPRLASTPIIALSAKAMPEDRKNILETGADDYLSKPVDYDVLSNMTALWCAKRHV